MSVHIMLMAILLWPSALPIVFTAETTAFIVLSFDAATVSIPQNLLIVSGCGPADPG